MRVEIKPPSDLTWEPHVVARLALTIAAATFLINVFERFVIAWKVPDSAEQEHAMQQEISELKRQAAVLNTPETFAQCAKAERKALALEKDLARVQHMQTYAKASYLLKMPQLARAVALSGLVILSFSVPAVAMLPPEATWPVGKYLAAFSGMPAGMGAVGLIPWCFICQRVTKAIVYGGSGRRRGI